MASPIQNLISIGAAGAQPNLVASAAAKSPLTTTQHTSGVQQIIAAQAAKGMTRMGEKRITDDKEVIDPTFDSEEHASEEDGKTEDGEKSINTKSAHKRLLDVVA